MQLFSGASDCRVQKRQGGVYTMPANTRDSETLTCLRIFTSMGRETLERYCRVGRVFKTELSRISGSKVGPC